MNRFPSTIPKPHKHKQKQHQGLGATTLSETMAATTIHSEMHVCPTSVATLQQCGDEMIECKADTDGREFFVFFLPSDILYLLYFEVTCPQDPVWREGVLLLVFWYFALAAIKSREWEGLALIYTITIYLCAVYQSCTRHPHLFTIQ